MKPRLSRWIGRHRTVTGQFFECVAVDSMRSREGRTVPLLRWRSNCADCGEAFTFVTARKPADTALQRRCAEHNVTPRKARRLRRRGMQVPTPGLLDLLVVENPDGTLMTMAGDIIGEPAPPGEREAHGITRDDVVRAIRRMLADASSSICA